MLSRARRRARRRLHAGRDEDIDTGTKTNQRIRTEDKVERPSSSRAECSISTRRHRLCVMDKENYEQLTLSEDMLEDRAAISFPTPR